MSSAVKTAEYFPHDCNASDDPKIMVMMAQLGLEAYGIYWILIEYLREQPGYRAPLYLLDPLSRRYGSSREKFEAIVMKFGLFEHDDKEFFSTSLQRRMEPMEEKRKRNKENILKRWGKNTNVLPPYNDGITTVIQSKVKKSKVKKSKEEKSKEENTDAFLASLPLSGDNPNQDLIKTWCRWVEFRKKLKKPYKTQEGTAAAYNKLLGLAGNDSTTAMAIINQSIENEWIGLFPLKAVQVTPAPGEDMFDRQRRELKEARLRREKREAEEKLKKVPVNGN